MRTRPQRLLAYALIAIGVIMLLSRIGGADWLWLALISAIFLVGYVSRQNYNFLVAGGVLMGIAVGTLIGTDSGILLSLAAGFLAIDRVEPKPNRWALYSAGVFAVLGALVALGSFGLLSSVALALILVAAGAYLLYREGNKPKASQTPAYRNTYTPPPASGPTPTAPSTPQAASSETGTETAGAETVGAPPPPATATPEADSTSAQTQTNSASSTAETPEPVSARPLSEEAQTRLQRLESWRRETAKAEGVPAYIVFTNGTLTKIAAANPQTLGELATVKGVGPIKQSRYGETVLSVLQDSGSGEGENRGSDSEGSTNA